MFILEDILILWKFYLLWDRTKHVLERLNLHERQMMFQKKLNMGEYRPLSLYDKTKDEKNKCLFHYESLNIFS